MPYKVQSLARELSPAFQHTLRLISLFTVSLIITACGDQATPHPSAKVQLSEELQQRYLQTCAQCHTKPATGAPQTGDAETWRAILSKGMESTLERTLNGYGGMPPGGQCFECSPEDLSLLILFMSQPMGAVNTSSHLDTSTTSGKGAEA
jgi:cytochrome c5